MKKLVWGLWKKRLTTVWQVIVPVFPKFLELGQLALRVGLSTLGESCKNCSARSAMRALHWQDRHHMKNPNDPSTRQSYGSFQIPCPAMLSSEAVCKLGP